VRFTRLPGRIQWQWGGEALADDSCGGSFGFQGERLAPNSLLIPGGGTINRGYFIRIEFAESRENN